MARFVKRTRMNVRTIRLCLLTFSFACLAAGARRAAVEDATSEKYLNTQPGVVYVGDEACQECHESQYRDFKKTGMGRSLSIPGPGNWAEFVKPVTLFSKKLHSTYRVSVIDGKMYHTESRRDANGKPQLSVSAEEAAGKDSEWIACEVECRRAGIEAVFVDLEIPGLIHGNTR